LARWFAATRIHKVLCRWREESAPSQMERRYILMQAWPLLCEPQNNSWVCVGTPDPSTAQRFRRCFTSPRCARDRRNDMKG